MTTSVVAVRPVELNAKPATGRPSRTTSVITATTEVVISEKSKPEFASDERSGTAFSRISVMRILSGSQHGPLAHRPGEGRRGAGGRAAGPPSWAHGFIRLPRRQ